MPDSLQPYYPAGERDWGIAWAQIAEDYAAPAVLEKAWPLLRTAAGSRPRDPLLYAKIAEALESAQKNREAETVYELSLEQDPAQPDVLLRLAALCERSGDSAKAAALRRRAAAILPRPAK